MMDAIVEEQVRFGGGGPELSGVLAYPAERMPGRMVLLCAPHPHFAGNMDNNVIACLARSFAVDSLTLRFDYRGVGSSGIELEPGCSVFDYWQQVEEKRAYADAMEDIRAAMDFLKNAGSADLPIFLAGYSFGAAAGMMFGLRQGQLAAMAGIAPPLTRIDFAFLVNASVPRLLVVGKDDFLYSQDRIDALEVTSSEGLKIRTVEGMDHFFRGEEPRVFAMVNEFFNLYECKRESCNG